MNHIQIQEYALNWVEQVWIGIAPLLDKHRNYRGRPLSFALDADLETIPVNFGGDTIYVPTSLSAKRTAEMIQERIDQFLKDEAGETAFLCGDRYKPF